MAALPVKFERYSTLGSAVTTRASSDRDTISARIARCRSLRCAVVACDMNGVEQHLEGLDGLLRAFLLGIGWRRRRWRRRWCRRGPRRRCELHEFLGRLLERQPF